MGPSALFLRVAVIRAGVKGAGVKRAVFWLKKNKSGVILKIYISSKWHEISYLTMFLHTIALFKPSKGVGFSYNELKKKIKILILIQRKIDPKIQKSSKFCKFWAVLNYFQVKNSTFSALRAISSNICVIFCYFNEYTWWAYKVFDKRIENKTD